MSVVKSLSHVRLFATPWTVACQAPPFMGFSRQEYWSGLSFPSPGDLPDPGIETGASALEADTLPSEPPGKSSITYVYTVSAEKAMANHSSTLAWKIPWMEEPARLQSMGSLRVGHN